MTISDEAKVKEDRIHKLLDKSGYDSLLIARRENFAWLSCGGRAVTSYVVENAPVYLLVTPKHKYAIGYCMDMPRTMDEELAGQGYDPVVLPTFGKTPEEVAYQLARGRLAADCAIAGLDSLAAEVTDLHEPFLPDEMARYRAAGKEAGQLIHQLADWVQPGMTERQVLGHMWGLYAENNFDGDCMFVVSDERIRRYRHAVPSNKVIGRVVILAPATYKYGLHFPVSRVVYFSQPTDDERRRHLAVSTIQAAMIANSWPGMPLNSMRQICMDLFDQLGFPEEKTNHVHGGPTGYRVSYPERCQDPKEVVKPNMAFGWYITVAGAKSEEVTLVEDQGSGLITVDPTWPMIEIEYQGQKIAVSDVLVR
ncbi:MAG TPA: M24 family metallopeptidase [Anaerolineaceae bacterium]|nr:M24 family metallopeptidase [Anaerolineaceae bacterium]